MAGSDYDATFSRGELVVIAPREVLEKYHRKEGYAYGVTDEQFAFAGEVAQVINIGMYHCEWVLYQLGRNRSHLEPPEALRGVWFEACVSEYVATLPELPGYPLASSYYHIDAEQRGEHWYLVVRDPHGVECLATRWVTRSVAESQVRLMREIAARRETLSFERKFGFHGTFELKRVQEDSTTPASDDSPNSP